MSGFGGGGSGFQIFSDSSNSENQNAAMRKTKRDEVSGKPPATKRAALGEISNNTRVQPLRAVKQGQSADGFSGFGTENAGKGQKSAFQFSSQTFANIVQQGGSFKIHVDSSVSGPSVVSNVVPTVASSNVSSIPASVTSLHSRGLPHSSLVTAPITPYQPIVIDDDDDDDHDDDDFDSTSKDSPMLLDTSCHISVEHIKKQNITKVLTVPEYADAIYVYLRETEGKHHPIPYMKKQQDINCNMRNILVDWLIEVAEEYRLHRETLMLSVNYIDRFLGKMSVNRKKLQLVGAASMFLASKYEEIYPPEVTEFVYITDNTYTKEEVLKMEHLILKVLSFDVAVPTANLFCERFLHQMALTEDDKVYHLAMMLAELTMLDSDTYLNFLPSNIAAASIVLANHTLGKRPVWPAHMVLSAKYTVNELAGCVQALFFTFAGYSTHPQQACFDKYKQAKCKEVSLLPPPKTLPPGCSAMQS